MSAPLDLSPAEIGSLRAVLDSPEHRTGIDDHVMTITRIQERAPQLVRLTAIVHGDWPLDHWDVPNPTIRITVPEPSEELAAVPDAPRSSSRVYTLVEVDPEHRTITFDVVRHEEPSPAMRWLAGLCVGDAAPIVGPRPHRIPGPGSPRVLLADSSALPAATRILRTMPTDEETIVITAVPDTEHALLEDALAQDQPAGGSGTISLLRADPTQQHPLSAAFAALQPPATASVWASGERDDMRRIRSRCTHELGLPPERRQVFGYWKRGVSNTRLDIARLRATRQLLDEGRDLADLDDFDVEP